MNHFIHPTLRMLLDYFQEKEQVMCNTLLFLGTDLNTVFP